MLTRRGDRPSLQHYNFIYQHVRSLLLSVLCRVMDNFSIHLYLDSPAVNRIFWIPNISKKKRLVSSRQSAHSKGRRRLVLQMRRKSRPRDCRRLALKVHRQRRSIRSARCWRSARGSCKRAKSRQRQTRRRRLHRPLRASSSARLQRASPTPCETPRRAGRAKPARARTSRRRPP